MTHTSGFEVRLAVVPVAGLRSPAAETVLAALGDLGFDRIGTLSMGKFFIWETVAPTGEAAREEAQEMANRLLRNPVTEEAFVLSITPTAIAVTPTPAEDRP